MNAKSGHRTKRILIIVATMVVLVSMYRLIILPSMLTWGSTAIELKMVRPGDEFIRQKEYRNNLAVSVKGTPSEIWPWIAQMGLHKGGFYSHTWLENLFGCKLQNADSIHLEWQQVEVGAIEPVCASQEGKPASGWEVAVVNPGKALVWKGRKGEWMMGIYIDSIDQRTSRLVTRQQFKYPGKWSVDWWLEKVWFDWAHCIMQKGMIDGIRDRVEAH